MLLTIRARIIIIKSFLLINGVVLFFWWPLSHWLYPDLYHQLLGFKLGSYQDSLVKVIGTCGVFIILLSFFAAKNPIKNRDMIKTLIISAFLIALTFIYLIARGDFPTSEFINVGLSLFSALILQIIYPWKTE